jgi:Ca-activated chloride channel family protein
MNEELVDEVTYLAKRYGIITPYTSYLMADDLATNGPIGQPMTATRPGFGRRQLLSRLADESKPAADGVVRESRVRDSKKLARYRSNSLRSGAAGALDAAVEEQLALSQKGGKKRSSLEAIRYIGSRTFYKRGKQWEEGTFDPSKDKTIKTIEIGSDEYLKLLNDDPRLAKYLALGDVLLKVKKTWYRVEARKRG